MAKRNPTTKVRGHAVSAKSGKVDPPEQPLVGLNPKSIKKRMDSDNALRKAVSGQSGNKVPLVKMTEPVADIYKKAGIVGEGGPAPRAPKQSTFNRPLRGAKPTGGAQHSRANAEEGRAASPHEAAYNETDKAWADREEARTQLSASGPVSGTSERKNYSQRAQLALRHSGGFVAAGVKSRGRSSSEAESHRAAVHGLIGGMSNNEKLTLAGAEIPCSSAGCSRAHTVQGNDVVQGNLSCGSRGQNCNIPGAETPTRRPVGLVDESRATKRLNPSGEKTVPR